MDKPEDVLPPLIKFCEDSLKNHGIDMDSASYQDEEGGILSGNELIALWDRIESLKSENQASFILLVKVLKTFELCTKIIDLTNEISDMGEEGEETKNAMELAAAEIKDHLVSHGYDLEEIEQIEPGE